MAASTAEKTRFRRKLDGTETTMPDTYIDDVFDEAESDYSGYTRKVIVAAAYVLCIKDMKARASKLTDYDQNDSSEKRSQLLKNLDNLLKDYEGELAVLLESETVSPAFFGVSKVKPSRLKEYPDA